MRRYIILLVAVFGATTLFAQSDGTSKGTHKTKKFVTHLKWSKTDIDLGEIPQGKPATAKYEFVNNGTKPVLITKVNTTCGCTSKKYTKTPIKPHEKGVIYAIYDAKRIGKFNKVIAVKTTEGRKYKTLRIRGTVAKK